MPTEFLERLQAPLKLHAASAALGARESNGAPQTTARTVCSGFTPYLRGGSPGARRRVHGLLCTTPPSTMVWMDSAIDEACVSGALVCSLRDVVCESVGEEVVGRALARVPEEIRMRYEFATTMGWVPIDTMEKVFSAIAAELGRSLDELHESVARRSIERTMQTVWRVLLRFTSDRALVSRAPVLFAKAYNRGRLEASFPKPCVAEVRLYDWPDPPAWPLRATRIGIETALRLGNRKNVVVRAARAAGGATFTATWEA